MLNRGRVGSAVFIGPRALPWTNPTVYETDRRDWFDTDVISATSASSGRGLPT